MFSSVFIRQSRLNFNDVKLFDYPEFAEPFKDAIRANDEKTLPFSQDN